MTVSGDSVRTEATVELQTHFVDMDYGDDAPSLHNDARQSLADALATEFRPRTARSAQHALVPSIGELVRQSARWRSMRFHASLQRTSAAAAAAADTRHYREARPPRTGMLRKLIGGSSSRSAPSASVRSVLAQALPGAEYIDDDEDDIFEISVPFLRAAMDGPSDEENANPNGGVSPTGFMEQHGYYRDFSA